MLALAVALSAAADAGAAGPPPRVVIAVLPADATVEEIASVPGVAPGLVSSGIGGVPPTQTYLDVSQGNRINESLYDDELPPLEIVDGRVPRGLWKLVTDHAGDAPAELVPGLLGSTLRRHGVAVGAATDAGLGGLIAADERGDVGPPPRGRPALGVVGADLGELRRLTGSRSPDDLVIAIAAARGEDEKLLPAGIAGPGFDGDLTSDSTRTDGVVTATDIAPTVLDRFGIEAPDEINGAVISAGGDRDPARVAELQRRLTERPSRDVVVLAPLGIWLVLTAVVVLVGGAAAAATALRLLAQAAVWAPFVLLAVAAADAGQAAAALAVGVASPVLAVAGDRLLGPHRGLALACAVTVGAYALDVVAGSPYSSLSVLGPNPAYGARFFGIGNELEAILAALTVIGTGAWLAARPGLEPRAAAWWFAALALLAAAAFAPGRFGADVGAAIVLGVAAATAACLALGLPVSRTVGVVLAAGALGLLVLVAVDALAGGAHLTRSVLGAGDAKAVGDVFERRVELMLNTFTDPVYPELLVVTGALLALGLARARAVLAWFGERWPARCAFVGAVVGILVGTVANDSGSVLLVIGMIYLALTAGFAWATRPAGARADHGC